MNIYFLSQTENNNYDTYDSCVVIAETEEEAKLIHPNKEEYRKDINSWLNNYAYEKYLATNNDWYLTWFDWCKSLEVVTAKYILESLKVT